MIFNEVEKQREYVSPVQLLEKNARNITRRHLHEEWITNHVISFLGVLDKHREDCINMSREYHSALLGDYMPGEVLVVEVCEPNSRDSIPTDNNI